MHADILLLVFTGTVLNVVGQYLTATGFAAPRAQVIPWIRYGATFAYAGLARLRWGGGAQLNPHQMRLLSLIAGLETAAYVLFTLGFYACGPALSSLVLAAASQVLTASASHFVLGKKLTARQATAIAVILLGLALRWEGARGAAGKGDGRAGDGGGLPPDVAAGLLAILTAAALYTGMGLAYERLLGEDRPSYADVSWHSSKLGFALTSAFMLLYTLPRRETLLDLSRPVPVAALVLAFAGGMNVHSACQAHVFGTRGALGVTLANALRGGVLTLVTAALFCVPDKPWLCLSARSALSVAVTALGGVLWGLASRAAAQQPQVLNGGSCDDLARDRDAAAAAAAEKVD